MEPEKKLWKIVENFHYEVIAEHIMAEYFIKTTFQVITFPQSYFTLGVGEKDGKERNDYVSRVYRSTESIFEIRC